MSGISHLCNKQNKRLNAITAQTQTCLLLDTSLLVACILVSYHLVGKKTGHGRSTLDYLDLAIQHIPSLLLMIIIARWTHRPTGHLQQIVSQPRHTIEDDVTHDDTTRTDTAKDDTHTQKNEAKSTTVDDIESPQTQQQLIRTDSQSRAIIWPSALLENGALETNLLRLVWSVTYVLTGGLTDTWGYSAFEIFDVNGDHQLNTGELAFMCGVLMVFSTLNNPVSYMMIRALEGVAHKLTSCCTNPCRASNRPH